MRMYEQMGRTFLLLDKDKKMYKVDEVIEFMMNASYQSTQEIHFVFHRQNLPVDFFNLRSGYAGELLQKLMNYQMTMGVIGDFNDISCPHFQAFMYECNCRGHVRFSQTLQKYMSEMLAIT